MSESETNDINSNAKVIDESDSDSEDEQLFHQDKSQKAKKDLSLLAKEHTEEALTTILDIMRDPEVSPEVRLRAANNILDRGYGKPTQHKIVAVHDTDSLESFKRVLLKASKEATIALSDTETLILPSSKKTPLLDGRK